MIKKIRVRCSGHLHEIGLNQKGQLMFFNHTKAELKAEQALCKLGAEPCRCLKFLEKWRKKQFYKEEFKEEAETIKSKHTRRLINNHTKQNYRIIDLTKLNQKLYIERQKNLSVKLAKRSLKKQNVKIISTHEYAGYDYLGYNFRIDTDITFIFNDNMFSILFSHDWWKIYKIFNGGIIDNKIITSVESINPNLAIVFAGNLIKHEVYKITLIKDNKKWKTKEEELI